jgi:hypothetical protein
MPHRPAVSLVAVLVTLLAWTFLPTTTFADDAGVIKVSKGTASIERSGQRLPVPVGTKVREGDVVTTGADGSVGITFGDNSLLSIGPNSSLVIDRFAFDATTHKGAFETSLNRGTLAAVSGKIAKQSPDAMKVRTPVAVLGIRGTEFLVRTGAPAGADPGR